MELDLVMGVLSALIGASLLVSSDTLAEHMKDGDDRYRGHPWLRVFEPTDGPLATDAGRIRAFRAWIVVSGAGFVAVGLALSARGALALA